MSGRLTPILCQHCQPTGVSPRNLDPHSFLPPTPSVCPNNSVPSLASLVRFALTGQEGLCWCLILCFPVKHFILALSMQALSGFLCRLLRGIGRGPHLECWDRKADIHTHTCHPLPGHHSGVSFWPHLLLPEQLRPFDVSLQVPWVLAFPGPTWHEHRSSSSDLHASLPWNPRPPHKAPPHRNLETAPSHHLTPALTLQSLYLPWFS